VNILCSIIFLKFATEDYVRVQVLVVVPIPDLYLVSLLSMHSVHFKCIEECVSR
jgi:hypothetical protein